MQPRPQQRVGAPRLRVHPGTGLVGTCGHCRKRPGALPHPTMKNIARTLASVLVLTYTASALARLQPRGRKPPVPPDVHTAAIEAATPARLRVAHGMPFNDYLGAVWT